MSLINDALKRTQHAGRTGGALVPFSPASRPHGFDQPQDDPLEVLPEVENTGKYHRNGGIGGEGADRPRHTPYYPQDPHYYVHPTGADSRHPHSGYPQAPYYAPPPFYQNPAYTLPPFYPVPRGRPRLPGGASEASVVALATSPRGIAAAALTLGIVGFLLAGFALWNVTGRGATRAEAPLAEPAGGSTMGVAAPAAQPPDQALRIHAFLDEFEISGVKLDGEASKLLASGRVYRLNDYVERSLGLRLEAMDEVTVTFTTDAGAKYTRFY